MDRDIRCAVAPLDGIKIKVAKTRAYISVYRNGKWIHDHGMTAQGILFIQKELQEAFEIISKR